MIKTENFKKLEIESASQLEEWLSSNHGQAESVWLVTYKKGPHNKYVSRDEVLDALLCFGWIDGIRRKLDENRTMQLISPRKVQHWARSYKERAARLIEAGKMQQPGLDKIAESKQNGLWNFMDDVDNLVVPPDLQKQLESRPGAADFFSGINDSSKRFVLRWIKLSKKEATRKNRIEKIAKLAAKGEKLPGS